MDNNTYETGFKKLKFFTDFLATEGITMEQAALAVDKTRPSISHWIAVDDARLSQLQTIIESFGYEFEIFLTREEDEGIGDKKIAVDDFIALNREDYHPKRLTFLTLALRRYDIGKVELARRIGVQYTAVRYYWAQDDITISTLMKIVEVCDFSIRISIKKKSLISKEDTTSKKSRRYYTVQITKDTSIEI